MESVDDMDVTPLTTTSTTFVENWTTLPNATEMIVDIIVSTLAPNTSRNARRRGGPFR